MLTDQDIALHQRIAREYGLLAEQTEGQIDALKDRLKYYRNVVKTETAILNGEDE